MPVHDWTRVDAGLFHDFHQSWTVFLRKALNTGGLPPNYFALVEQRMHGPIADVLTLELARGGQEPSEEGIGLAVAAAPPRARLIKRKEADCYAGKANRITVRHRHGKVVAVIEVVSPGNKSSRAELRNFVEKSADLIRQNINLLIVDLFPPGKRDPQGIHMAIWEELGEEDNGMPTDKPLTVAAYDAGSGVAYVESIAVGDALPPMALFLRPEFYVPTPLEATYLETWKSFPAPLKSLLQ